MTHAYTPRNESVLLPSPLENHIHCLLSPRKAVTPLSACTATRSKCLHASVRKKNKTSTLQIGKYVFRLRGTSSLSKWHWLDGFWRQMALANQIHVDYERGFNRNWEDANLTLHIGPEIFMPLALQLVSVDVATKWKRLFFCGHLSYCWCEKVFLQPQIARRLKRSNTVHERKTHFCVLFCFLIISCCTGTLIYMHRAQSSSKCMLPQRQNNLEQRDYALPPHFSCSFKNVYFCRVFLQHCSIKLH